MSEMYSCQSPERVAPKRSEGMRILWFLLFTAGVGLMAYVIRYMMDNVVYTAIDLFIMSGEGMLAETGMTVGQLMWTWSIVGTVAGVAVEIGIGLLNRGLTFRSRAGWYWTIPALIGVYLVFSVLTNALYGSVVNATLSGMTAQTVMSAAQASVVLRSVYNPVRFCLWVVVSYVFQRFVLYRKTLDTNGLARRAGGYNG